MNEKLKPLVAHILEESYLLSLATVDEEGVWVADVVFTYDDNFNIYWMSVPERRHSFALQKNTQVAGTITSASGPDSPANCLQISGVAERVDDIPPDSVLRYFRKRNQPEPKPDEDILGEHFWYKFTPNRIELLYEPEFGYDRQTVL